jgi:hypothetical protein
MSEHTKPLVGSVFERKPGQFTSVPSVPKAVGSKTGFPMAQHRSKSVFARNRDAQQQPATLSPRVGQPPVVQLEPRTQVRMPSEEPHTDDWRVRMGEENESRVAAMSEEEREQERREIEEKFGKNIGDVLRRARLAREALEKRDKAAAPSKGDLVPSQPGASGKTITPFVPPGPSNVL